MSDSQFTVAALFMSAQNSAAEDFVEQRAALIVTVREKAYIEGEMRQNLEVIQSIIASIAANDPSRAKDAAASREMSSYGGMDPKIPPALAAKYPQSYRAMTVGTRQGLDDLAKALGHGETGQQSLNLVSNLMQNCTSCHLTFRLEAKDCTACVSSTRMRVLFPAFPKNVPNGLTLPASNCPSYTGEAVSVALI